MDFLRLIRAQFHKHFVPSEQNTYRPHSLRRDFLISIVAAVCVVEGFLATSLTLQSHTSHFSASVLEGALISLTNAARADAHVGQLTDNPTLTLAAQAKAEDMAAHGYFSHVGPDGKQPWAWMHEAGYDYAYAGENLAAHFYDSSDVVQAWLNSPSHRENIMRGNYKEIGIGIARGSYQGTDTIFVVQFFGVTKAALGLQGGQKQNEVPAVAPSTPAAVADAPVSVAAVSAPQVQKQNVPAETSGAVKGSSISATPGLLDRLLSSPRTLAMWILLALLFIIALSIALAFFIRIHIQPVDLLINGMVVAAFVLCIIATNSYFFSKVDTGGFPAAAVSAFPAQ